MEDVLVLSRAKGHWAADSSPQALGRITFAMVMVGLVGSAALGRPWLVPMVLLASTGWLIFAVSKLTRCRSERQARHRGGTRA